MLLMLLYGSQNFTSPMPTYENINFQLFLFKINGFLFITICGGVQLLNPLSTNTTTTSVFVNLSSVGGGSAMSKMPPSKHLSRLLSSLSSLPPDMWLVSREGFSLPSHSLLLSLYSPWLRKLLPSSPTSLSLPLPAQTLSSLLSLLTTGSSTSSSCFNPTLVIEAAEVMGMNLEDLQIIQSSSNQGEDSNEQNDSFNYLEDTSNNHEDTSNNKEDTSNNQEDSSNYKKDTSHNKKNTSNNKEDTSDNQEDLFDEVKTQKIKKEPFHESLSLKNVDENIEDFSTHEHDLGDKTIEEHEFEIIYLLNETTRIYHCNQCDYKTDMTYKISNHMKTRHTEKIYQCRDCDLKTKDKYHLKKHMVAKHTGLRFNCDECDFQTAHKKDVKRHSETKHSDRQIQNNLCDICDFKTYNGVTLRRHKRKVHNLYEKKAYYKMAQLKKGN